MTRHAQQNLGGLATVASVSAWAVLVIFTALAAMLFADLGVFPTQALVDRIQVAPGNCTIVAVTRSFKCITGVGECHDWQVRFRRSIGGVEEVGLLTSARNCHAWGAQEMNADCTALSDAPDAGVGAHIRCEYDPESPPTDPDVYMVGAPTQLAKSAVTLMAVMLSITVVIVPLISYVRFLGFLRRGARGNAMFSFRGIASDDISVSVVRPHLGDENALILTGMSRLLKASPPGNRVTDVAWLQALPPAARSRPVRELLTASPETHPDS